MAATLASRFAATIKTHETTLLKDWIAAQLSALTLRPDLLKEAALRDESRQFLSVLQSAAEKAPAGDIKHPAWEPVKDMLRALSKSRAQAGFSPTETATFVFSLKQPLFELLRAGFKNDAEGLAEEIWSASTMLDQLGLYTTEAALGSREDVIARQQRELLELSTPVVELWDDILALPLVGTLDSERTQVVMETLLQKIVDTGASIAIIDITGVPTVDTLVAQHLIKTIAATRLMGADCIISGIRPQIAQTIVHLGVDLGQVTTKSTLAEAFKVALKRTGGSTHVNALAQQHYAEHKERPFFGELVSFITSGPVLALAVRGENAILGVRGMMGATNPADSAPGTIRGDFATLLSENIVHGSDSKASAKRELSLFFPDGLL